jgi:predicted CXXCH cytochrome family protein
MPTHPLILGLALILGAGACTETKYVERDPVNPPPDPTSGFLGYYDAASKQTTCGNCHISHQADWVSTAHASAWDALPANPPASCAGCHTVNGKGNGITDSAGYLKTQVAAYHDVQCESCHGPGETHANNPDGGTVPLPHIGLGDSAASCAACHSGAHTPYAEEWGQSGHADSVGMDHPATTAGCQGCHEGRAAIMKFNGNHSTRYIDSVGTKTIVCVVCHDPHGSPNEAQLRAPINTPDPTQNLCMQCHLRGTTPSVTYTRGGRGAHASQGPILLGENAGWIPVGFYFDSAGMYSSHGSTANPKLCAGCHVNRITVSDENGFVFQSTGHLFRPIPCVDDTGKPLADNSCDYTSTARNWSSCTNAGCHASATVAANFFNNERNTVKGLVDQLWTDVNGNKTLDAFPTDSGYLAQVYASTPGEFSNANGVSVAEGALFNATMFAEKTLYDHSDGSYGVHNPFYYEALLSASIDAMETQYALPAPRPELQAVMTRALARPGVRYAPPASATRVAADR